MLVLTLRQRSLVILVNGDTDNPAVMYISSIDEQRLEPLQRIYIAAGDMIKEFKDLRVGTDTSMLLNPLVPDVH